MQSVLHLLSLFSLFQTDIKQRSQFILKARKPSNILHLCSTLPTFFLRNTVTRIKTLESVSLIKIHSSKAAKNYINMVIKNLTYRHIFMLLIKTCKLMLYIWGFYGTPVMNYVC